MIDLLSRPSRRLAPARASRLLLTQLETRDCPAAPSVAVCVTPINGYDVWISGHVSDEAPELSTVQIAGVANLRIAPEADGSFGAVTTVSGYGYVTAEAIDVEGLHSSIVGNVFMPENPKNRAPVIENFSASEEGGVWTISGHVNDERPAGMKVTLRSSIPQLNNRVVKCDENGDFVFRFTEPGNFYGGSVSAQTTDDMGVDSTVVYTFVG